MNEKKTSDWKLIIGGIALIIVLFISIKFVFWGLGQVIRREDPGGGQSVTASQDLPSDPAGSEEAQAPRYCVHCGQGLPEGFQWGQFCPYCGKKVE